MFESTQIIAHKQFYKARQLFLDDESQIQLRGRVRFVHEHIDMTKQEMPAYRSAIELARRDTSGTRRSKAMMNASTILRTCDAALGYSFAAGTTDGPGAFDFQQGDTVSTRYWNMMRDFLRRPSDKQIQCHHPKPILLSTGEMDFPYMWHPRVVSTQLFMIGQLAIVGLPGEFTTMSGRRVREAVQRTLYEAATRGTSTPSSVLTCDKLDDDGDDNHRENNQDLLVSERDDETSACRNSRQQEMSLPGGEGRALRRKKRAYSLAPEIRVVLSGLSNVYTSYVATVEEYEVQRYEGASTLYGPHTLQAYLRQFERLARLIMDDQMEPPPSDLRPPDLTKSLFTLRAGVIFDGTQHGRDFGDVLQDVNSTRIYRCGDTVQVSFVAGNPRNDLRQETSFVYIERYQQESSTGVLSASSIDHSEPKAKSKWQTVATDASWETKFIWERTNTFFGESKATIVWDIPHDCRAGVYRVRHVGAHKNLMQVISPYSGKSTPFKVAAGTSKQTQTDSQARDELDAILEEALALAALEQTPKPGVSGGAGQSVSSSATMTPSFYSSAVGMLGSLFGLRPARH